MLDTNLKTQLKAYLEKVAQPFEIVASLGDGEKSQEMLSLLQDIAGLSDKITLKTDGDDARKPSFSTSKRLSALNSCNNCSAMRMCCCMTSRRTCSA